MFLRAGRTLTWLAVLRPRRDENCEWAGPLHTNAIFPTPTIDPMAGNRYIHISEYEDQDRSTPDQDDFPGALRPNSAADSQSAPRGRIVRLPHRRRIRSSAAHRLPAPLLFAQDRAGRCQERGVVDALPLVAAA